MRAIETSYKGYRFRSRLEARWAVFFDALGIEWEYEFEGYELDNGERYLPDFWLPRFHWPLGIHVEVKPTERGLEKAIEFVRSGGGAILCAVGSPCDDAYRLIKPYHSREDGLMDVITEWVAFKAEYLPGGGHEDEYRLYVGPQDCDRPYFDINHAIGAARAARFERRA